MAFKDSNLFVTLSTCIPTYTAPGDCTLILTVEDTADEKATKQYQHIVICGPNGGFVIGGGWFIDLATGAKANFGLNPKYQKDGTLEGGVAFNLNDLMFKSVSHEWMVMIDGQATGGGEKDKLRVIIWDYLTGDLTYDNEMVAEEFADPIQPIGGDSIVIHKAK